MNTLFVCLGNICRSPIAAGVMRRYFDEWNVDAIVDSAAVTDWNVGSPADRRAVLVARANGIDISTHRARQICAADFERFELILVMDNQNLRAIRKLAPADRLHTVRLLANDREIPDPYHADEAAFRQIFSIIDDSCRDLMHVILRK